MSTTLHLTYKRFVRRADSGIITNTQFLAAMDTVDGKLKTAPWVETDLLDAVHPVNSPSLGGFAGQAYDAYRQSGDAAPGTGRQCVYGGMALYRFSVPASASGTFINSLNLKVSGDKFLVGGLTIAAILSDSATPPTDWTLLRAGGVNATVDTSNQFAASAVVAETATLVSQSQNRTDAITLDLSDETSHHPWLWVAVSLTTFASYRREYWVEGSGALVGAECTVTFAGEVDLGAQAKIKLMNEFGYAATWRGDIGFVPAIDNCCSIAVKYVQTAGIAPEHELGDAAMMRRLLEQREMQSIGQLNTLPGGHSADNVVYGDFSIVGGLVGVTYSNLTGAPAFHRYRLHGVIIGRQTATNQETVDGVSLDVDIPALPVGMQVRISMYAHDGPIPAAHYGAEFGSRMCNNIFTMETATNAAFINGTATSAKLGSGETGIEYAMDSSLTYPATEISLIPLGTHDVEATLIGSGTKIPFAAPFKLPRFCVIFISFAVIGFNDKWVAAPGVNSVIDFKPSEIFLHVV